MVWWLLLGLALSVIVALHVLEWFGRAVARDVPAFRLMRYVEPFILQGRNGTGAEIYHEGSGILIEVTKCLSPDVATDGEVSLQVTKRRILPPKKLNVSSWWGMPSKGQTDAYALAPIWRVPRAHAGEVLAEIECGASLEAVRTAIEALVSEEGAFGDAPVFHVWCEKGCPGRVKGKFEEGGGEDQP